MCGALWHVQGVMFEGQTAPLGIELCLTPPHHFPRCPVRMLLARFWGCLRCPAAPCPALGLRFHSCCSFCPQVLRGVPAALPPGAIPALPALPHALRPQEGREGFQCGETALILQGSLQRLQQEGKAWPSPAVGHGVLLDRLQGCDSWCTSTGCAGCFLPSPDSGDFPVAACVSP